MPRRVIRESAAYTRRVEAAWSAREHECAGERYYVALTIDARALSNARLSAA
jgi:hypothetical protein